MKLLILMILIIVLLVFLEMKRELSYFRKVRYQILVDGLASDKKIVFLSDLHNHVYGKNNQELLDAIRDENPDLILIGGDILVGKNGVSYENALEFVKRLPQICTVYYANGNHEQRMKEIPENYKASFKEYKKELVAAGVHFLENSSIIFQWDDRNIKITGLEIPLGCYLHFHHYELRTDEVIERIGEKQAGYYEILLAHNPSYMKQYLERGADLILSGHLHGGIVRIPGVVGAISPSFELFPKYSGDFYQEGNTDIVVSKGLGTHTFNIRLFNPAELIVLNLKGN